MSGVCSLFALNDSGYVENRVIHDIPSTDTITDKLDFGMISMGHGVL